MCEYKKPTQNIMGQERSTQLSIGLKADAVFRRGRFGKWRVPCCCLLGVKPRERERNIGNLASLFKFPSNSLFFFCYVVGIIFHFKPGSLIERPSVPCCFGNSLSHHHDLSRKPYTLSHFSLFFLKKLLVRIEQFQISNRG